MNKPTRSQSGDPHRDLSITAVEEPLYCIVRCCGVRCAFAASQTVQVVEADRLVPLPKTPAWIVGITFYDSMVLPICSLERFVSPSEGGADQFDLRTPLLVVLEHQDARFSICIEEVLGFRPLEDLEPKSLDGPLAQLEQSTARDGGEATIVLDAEHLFACLRPGSSADDSRRSVS